MLSADPERAERHDGLLTSGGRSRGGILALCWVTPTPERRQHAAVSHEQSAQIYVYQQKPASRGLSLGGGLSRRALRVPPQAETPRRALPTRACSSVVSLTVRALSSFPRKRVSAASSLSVQFAVSSAEGGVSSAVTMPACQLVPRQFSPWESHAPRVGLTWVPRAATALG